MVSTAADTDHAMPGCGTHLRFTGLEPAVGLCPAGVMNIMVKALIRQRRCSKEKLLVAVDATTQILPL